jgi:FixJ family two-component response regulator
VVVITAFGSPSVAEVVKRKGAVLYLEKPVDPRAKASSHIGAFG